MGLDMGVYSLGEVVDLGYRKVVVTPALVLVLLRRFRRHALTYLSLCSNG